MITFTARDMMFENVTDKHAQPSMTALWQEAIAAVKAGCKFEITGGQCEAEGSVVVRINDRLWFYCEKVIIP